MTDSLFILALLVILGNAAVVLLGLHNHYHREKAKASSPNVVEIRYYRRTDVRV